MLLTSSIQRIENVADLNVLSTLEKFSDKFRKISSSSAAGVLNDCPNETNA